MKRSPLRLLSPPAGGRDGALMGRVADGDLAALAELYDGHARFLLRFVRRFAPREDAEDIVQTTFLRAIQVAPNYRQAAISAKPWLFGIAVRLVSERRRSLRRWAAMLAQLAAQHPISTAAQSERTDLERALDRLSQRQRVVLLLTEVEGFSGEEIAGLLGIPVGTVWTRLHHARQKLRHCFEEDA